MSGIRFSFSRAAWLAGAASIALAASFTWAQEAPLPPQAPTFADQLTREIRGVLEKSQSAICRIEGSDEHGTLRGTGFLVDADGTIVTSYSVGGESEELVTPRQARSGGVLQLAVATGRPAAGLRDEG